MRIGVRLDDIAPDINRERFERMIELLRKYHALPLLGVIPDFQDEKIRKTEGVTRMDAEAFWTEIRALKEEGAEIAMHGCRHVYTTKKGGMFPLNHQSEFAGLPYEEQLQLLKDGQEILKKNRAETDIFMAPAHSYDGNTLKALKECGFKRVTDGFGKAPYRFRELTFYPLAISKKRIARNTGEGTSTVVYHVNTMTDTDFETAEAYFSQISPVPWRELLYEPTVRRSGAGQRMEQLAAGGKRMLLSIRGRR